MKKIYSIIALICFSFSCFCGNVDEATAIKVAKNFMQINSHIKDITSCELAYKIADNEGTSVYVFNINNNSFVIVSGNDVATPILGYCTNNAFNVDDAPAALIGYIDGFDEEIAMAEKDDVKPSALVAQQWENVLSNGHLQETKDDTITIVEPMVNVFWNQTNPYNSMCPRDPDGPGGHVLTGCTSTAMAMIMRHWEYPHTGSGSHSYTPSGYPVQNVNFGNSYYDFSLMDSVLTEESPVQNIIAVARFMWHCGVSINSSYGPDLTSASPSSVGPAMVSYFNYAPSTNMKYKSSYSDIEWKNMVRESLDAGIPLHYSGWNSSGGGGHSFICDGYQNNDLFHFNWGWGGSYDGFFALDAMIVANYDFSYSHMALFNAVPPQSACGIPYNIIAKPEYSSVKVQWLASDYDREFNVYRDGELIATTDQTIYWDENLENGTYTYRISGVCKFGESDMSNAAIATINFEYILGDANLDSVVNILDIVSIASYITNNETDIYFDNADVNSDGVIDVLDIVEIINLIYNK